MRFRREGREWRRSECTCHFWRTAAPKGSRVVEIDRAHVAQLVEHILGKDEVTGSIPVVGSTEKRDDSPISRSITKEVSDGEEEV
jgi:hypothetical protein